jgi:ABC-2 type transport system permease protein
MTTHTKRMINHDLIVAARQGLVPVRENTRLGGFGNMLRIELNRWWGTRTWRVQILIWVLILDGISTIVMKSPVSGGSILEEVVQTFLPMAIIAVGIGTVITAQGALVGEKQLGTAAWVMSKPASRSGFILAKDVAYLIGFWICALIIPAFIFFIILSQLIPEPLSLVPFLAGLAVAALSQLFYLTLTLMLGTLFDSRGAVVGIGIAFILVGMLLKSLIPLPIMILTPWPLPDISTGLALGSPLPDVWFVPIITTGIWILVMTGVALWRFEREEF